MPRRWILIPLVVLGCRSRGVRQESSDHAPRAILVRPTRHVSMDAQNPCQVVVQDGANVLHLRLACDLSAAESDTLARVLELARREDWSAASALARRDSSRETQSLDLMYLAALTRLHLKILGEVSSGLVTGHPLCRVVASSPGPVAVFASADLSQRVGTRDFPGTTNTSNLDGDPQLILDTVAVLAQTSDAVRLATTSGDTVWVGVRSLYLDRFAIEQEETGGLVWSVLCLPKHPFRFELQGDSVYLTIFPQYETLEALARAYSIGNWQFILPHWEWLSEGVRSLPTGIGAVVHFDELAMQPAPRRPELIPRLLGFTSSGSDYGLPDRATCGRYPHGPTARLLCYHEYLTRSPDGRLRAYWTRPHNNLY